jgi:hypothetical protein
MSRCKSWQSLANWRVVGDYLPSTCKMRQFGNRVMVQRRDVEKVAVEATVAVAVAVGPALEMPIARNCYITRVDAMKPVAKAAGAVRVRSDVRRWLHHRV